MLALEDLSDVAPNRMLALEDLSDAIGRVRIVEQASSASDADAMLSLPPELIIVILEQLSFDQLLAARLTCVRLRDLALCVTRLLIQRCEQLWVPLLRPFGSSLLCIEVENAHSDWLPRLGCVMGVLPRLRRLFVRRAKVIERGSPRGLQRPVELNDAATLAVAGALQAGACPQLHHFNIDERLPDHKVMLIARAMRPDGGLLFAASHGYESVVEEMLTRGASPEAELEDGATALLVAAYHPGHSIVRMLLAHNANVNPRRHDGVTPLIMAANRGHLGTVEALLEAKAEASLSPAVNLSMRDGTTALHTATYKQNEAVVSALIAAGAGVQARCYDGVSSLLMAAKSGNGSLVRLLLGAKAEVDSPLRDGGTPLLAAAYKGHANVLSALLDHRASVDACRPDGLTPLCQASKAGHTRCVELLLAAGANIEAAGAVYGTTSLLMASKGGHRQIVSMLLEHNADTEVAGRAYGTTSLVAAAQAGHTEVVQLLLAGGADPQKTLNDGSNALSKAREHGQAAVVQVLRQAMGHEVYAQGEAQGGEDWVEVSAAAESSSGEGGGGDGCGAGGSRASRSPVA